MSPAIKGDDTPDHNALLWACVACDSQGRMSLPPSAQDMSAVVARTQLEMGFDGVQAWEVTLLEKIHKRVSKLYQKQYVFSGSGIIFTRSSIILTQVYENFSIGKRYNGRWQRKFHSLSYVGHMCVGHTVDSW